MKANELLLAQFQRVCDEFAQAAKDLDTKQMNWQPMPGVNTIGFLLWHVLRTWDSYYAHINRVVELYAQDHWAQRFGFDTKGKGVVGKDEEGIGTGFTTEDVAIVKPQAATLIAYRDALWIQLQEYLSAAPDETLTREVIIPWWRNPKATPARVLSHIIAHSLVHLGEAQYVRGLSQINK